MSRALKNLLFCGMMRLAVLLCAAILFFLLAVIFWNGVHGISPSFVLTAARDFGASGGILYQILGTILLVVTAGLISFPLALGTAIFKSEFLRRPALHRMFDLLVYGLNGVPSIIFGLFGLIFFVTLLGTGISWFVGSVILAIMILPAIVLATYQAINGIPQIYRESARALGLNRWQVIRTVILPQGLHGAVTGLLLGLARAAGETAPIMFIATAFSGVDIPGTLLEPVSALPTHILALAQQANDPRALQNGWSASLVLLSLVLLLSSAALYSRVKFNLRRS